MNRLIGLRKNCLLSEFVRHRLGDPWGGQPTPGRPTGTDRSHGHPPAAVWEPGGRRTPPGHAFLAILAVLDAARALLRVRDAASSQLVRISAIGIVAKIAT